MRQFILASAIVLLAACVDPGVTNCGTYVCPAKLMCDPSGHGCINPDRVMQCKNVPDFTPCSYEGVPDGACYNGICSPGGCGNGVVDPNEICDDGNRNNGDGCSASCDSDETCGNGVPDLAVGEGCDDADLQSHDGCSSVCSIEKITWTYAGGGEPPALYGNRYPAVFDRARGRLVIAGGNVSNFSFETWEWSGIGWVRAFSDPTHPPLRYRSALAYDARRRVVVMFGGRDGAATSTNDTWEWDGRAWTQVLTPTAPSPRHSHALAYDAARGKIVLYGGTNYDLVSNGSVFDDTWEYDGHTWTRVTTATQPPVVWGHAMTYDPARARVVMITDNAVWEYDGADWHDRTPANASGAFGYVDSAAVYDPVRARVVVFGGHDVVGTVRGSTWEWDGTAMTEFAGAPTMPTVSADYDTATHRISAVVAQPSGHFEVWARAGTAWTKASPPAASPPGREQHAVAYDPVRDRVVLFGGRAISDAVGGGSLPIEYGDTWEWDGTRWYEVTPASGSPAPRDGHAMAYDAITGRILMFGGTQDGSSDLGDTWAWDGTTWTNVTPATSSPPPRTGAGMAAAADGSIVLFGGSAQLAPLNDTWIWNGSAWAKRTLTKTPPARSGCRMALDDAGAVMLFGGESGTGTLTDTWRWDGTRWTDVSPAGDTPATRDGFAMASDGYTVWLTTGTGSGGLFDDLWAWSGGQWLAYPEVGRVLPPRTGSAMVQVSGGRVVLFGGTAPSIINQTYFDDTWLFNSGGGGWSDVTSRADVPAARRATSSAYMASRGEVVMFGGFATSDDSYPLGDTWRWSGGGWQIVEGVTGPPARGAATLAYDSGRDRVALFGGAAGVALFGDVWEWDGTRWYDMTPTGASPSPRRGAAVAYDVAHNVIVLFGGYTGTPDDETWLWNGSAWTNVTAATRPPAREGASMVYDPLRQRVVLFGGDRNNGSPLQDTWEWDGTSWTDVTPAVGSPENRIGHTLIYDRASRQVLLVLGVTPTLQTRLPVFAWNGQTWTELESTDGPPFLRLEATAAYDDARNRIISFGGVTTNLITQTQRIANETWTAAFDSVNPDETCLYGVDGDHDGLLGCEDPDCAGYCYPLCPPGTSCTTGQRCGDGVCDPRLETCRSCAQDCGACSVVCGDSLCDPGETAAACPGDCTAP